MNKLEQIKMKLQSMLLEFAEVKTDKGILSIEGDEIAVGNVVEKTNEDGTKSAVEDGEYKLEDGKTIVIADGKVSEIIEAPTEEDTTTDESGTTETGTTEVTAAEETTTEEIVEEVVEDKNEIEEIKKEINELYKIVDAILKKIGETRDEADARFAKIENSIVTKSSEIEMKEVTKSVNDTDLPKAVKMMREMKK